MEQTSPSTNFIHDIIDSDLACGRETAVHTRFPPEPNGYLHIGSAKAIWINAGTAQKYGGLFNLRYDDTNPEKEDDEYVKAIYEDIRWLGFEPDGGVFYGSDYFDKCYEFAVKLIRDGKAYVCDLSPEDICMDIIRQFPRVRGVVHSYSGSAEISLKGLLRGSAAVPSFYMPSGISIFF